MWVEINKNGLPPEPGIWKVMNLVKTNPIDQRLLFYKKELGWLDCGTYNRTDLNPTHYWSVIWEKNKR